MSDERRLAAVDPDQTIALTSEQLDETLALYRGYREVAAHRAERISELNRQLLDIRTQNRQLSDRVKQLERRTREDKATLKQLFKDREVLRERVARLRTDHAALREERVALRRRVRRYEAFFRRRPVRLLVRLRRMVRHSPPGGPPSRA